MRSPVEHIFNFSSWCGDQRNVFEEEEENDLLDKNRIGSMSPFQQRNTQSKYPYHAGRPPRKRNNTGNSQWTPTSKQSGNTTKATPETHVSDGSFVSRTNNDHPYAQQSSSQYQQREQGIWTSFVQSFLYRCGDPIAVACGGFTASSATANHHIRRASTDSALYNNDQDLQKAIQQGLLRAQRSNTMDENDDDMAYQLPPSFINRNNETEQRHSNFVQTTIGEEKNINHSEDITTPFTEIRTGADSQHNKLSRSQDPPQLPDQTNPTATKTIQLQPPPSTQPGSSVVEDTSSFPLQELVISRDKLIRIERSVSELTMRSHGDNYLDFLPTPGKGTGAMAPANNRRMAYYAVGKKAAELLKQQAQSHEGKGRPQGGSHRRCYFSGRVIHTGDPFYAGSVQQGLRTLVVFCLPKSLGLTRLCSDVNSNALLNHNPCESSDGTVDNDSSDETVFKTAEEQEALLRSLPEANEDLLFKMKSKYSEAFESLPLPIQSPTSWKLFIKFCFFSGLPVAEGEMHFRVKPTLLNREQSRGKVEDVVLSHEVMEAVNGETSAEMLRLPNNKTFTYLKRHYAQQSSKLDPIVFNRTSWEMVLPEC